MKKNLFCVLICLLAVFALMSMTAAADAADPQIEVGCTAALTYEPIRVSVTAPGNRTARVHFFKDDNLFLMQMLHLDDNGQASESFKLTEAGHYEVMVDSMDTGMGVVMGTAEVDVTAPYGALAEPVLSTSEPVLGKDLVLSFQPVENADSYTIDFHGDNLHKHEVVAADQLELVIPASELTKQTYRFGVTATAVQKYGYLASSSTMQVTILEPKDENLTISADKTKIQASEPVTIRLDAPGAYALRIYENGRLFSDRLLQEGENTVTLEKRLRVGTYTYWFEATYDRPKDGDNISIIGLTGNENYDRVSNQVTLTVTGDGDMKPSGFTVEPVEHVGDHIRITVNQVEDGLVEYATSIMYMSPWNMYMTCGKKNFTHEGAGTFTVEMSSVGMKVDTEYILSADCYKLGKNPYSQSFDTCKFTIQNPAQSPLLDCYPDTIRANEKYTICVDALDYTSVRLDYQGQGNSWSNVYKNSTMSMTFKGSTAGTDTVTMYVSNDEETWTKVGTCSVTITAPKGILDTPDLGLKSELLQPGEDLVITVKPVKGAASQAVRIKGDGVDQYVQLSGDNMQVVIPASKLTPLSLYEITAWATTNEIGVSGSTINTHVFIGGSYDNVLTLPADLKQVDDAAFQGIDASCVVVPEGTTSIGSKAFANCRNLRYVFLPGTVTSIASDAFSGCQDLIIFAGANNTVASSYAKTIQATFIAKS